MKLTAASRIMLALLLVGMLTPAFNVQPATASLPVHNINTGLSYATIQEAINAPETSNGHTIFVEEGTYYEHVVINKNLSLIGEKRSTTVIDGNGTGNVIVIDVTAYHVNVTGFTIRNGTNGIFINYSDYNTISGNIVTNNQNGINLFSECTCNPANGSTITNNTIKDNSIGICLKISSNNAIYHNNFINNTTQQADIIGFPSYTNFWDDGYPSGGNYWSDYEERYPNAKELDGLGIWDTPYVINGNNRDRYPLMEPWSLLQYELTVASSPITGITFTINGVPHTTPYTERLLEGLYTLVMPETHDGYVWFRWREDGDTNRIKTVTMDTNITLTGMFTNPPVGGIYVPVNKLELLAPYVGLTLIVILPLAATVFFIKLKKKKQ